MVVARTRGRLVKKAARVAGKSAGARYARYGLVVLGGFAVVVLLGRRRKREEASPSPTQATQATHASDVPTSDPGSAQGWRDEEFGSANPTQGAGGDGGEGSAQGEPEAGGLETEGEAPPVPPSEPPRQEDPPDRADITTRQGEIERLIRARIEGDPRTSDLQLLGIVPLLGIDVDDGRATIEGSAPSAEAKEALTEVVGDVEGVNIVVNNVRVISA